MLGVFPHFLPELGGLRGVQQSDPHLHDAWDHTLSVMTHLEDLLDNVLVGGVGGANGLQASLLTLGIGRYRQHLTKYFASWLNPDCPLRGLLQFVALFHDVGKRATQTRDADGRIHFLGHENAGAKLAAERASQFNLSNAEVDWIQTAVGHHLRFFFLANRMEAEGEAPSRRAVYRFFRDAGQVAVGLILLGLADLQGTRDHLLTEKSWSAWVRTARLLLENLWEKPEEAVAPPRLLDGNDLMRELAIPPGPAVGQLLDTIREAQAAGEVRDQMSALDFARKWISREATSGES